MIISDKYKYVFVQLDKTASSAIAKELVENYNGKTILWKHARYEDFMKFAEPEQKKYFIFSGIRNPLDTSVSYYFFFKNNRACTNKTNFKKIQFILKTKADFKSYFKKFHNTIYEDWKTKNFRKLNYIYRYENLQEDFSKILKILKIKQIRPLPIYNKTPDKDKKFLKYYHKDIQGLAKIVFEKFMKRWNYKFPKNWQEPTFYQRFILKNILYVKHILQIIYHFIIDNPLIYQKYYNLKNENSNFP